MYKYKFQYFNSYYKKWITVYEGYRLDGILYYITMSKKIGFKFRINKIKDV